MVYDGKERRQHSMDCQAEILEKVNRIVEFIEGNGKPGAKIRIDRLEQVEQNRIWAWRTMFGCVAGLVLKAVFDLMVR